MNHPIAPRWQGSNSSAFWKTSWSQNKNFGGQQVCVYVIWFTKDSISLPNAWKPWKKRRKRPFEQKKSLLIIKNQPRKSKQSKKGRAGWWTFQIIYIYIYICICCGVIIWTKFGLLRCYYLGQVCFLQNTVCQKRYKNRGFNIFEKLHAQIWGAIIWAKLAIFKLQSTWPRQ